MGTHAGLRYKAALSEVLPACMKLPMPTKLEDRHPRVPWGRTEIFCSMWALVIDVSDFSSASCSSGAEQGLWELSYDKS